ncbi:MAG: hypothetical protein WAX12_11005, partial [Candidatus Microthrix subdominans]
MGDGTIDQDRIGGAAKLSADKFTTTTRDPDQLGRRIGDWLGTKLGKGSNPTVFEVSKPEGNGMSSETLLFSARW